MYKIYMEYYKESTDTERTRSLISGSSFDMQLIEPTVSLVLNKAGKAEFSVPSQHPYYSYIAPMINNIEICEVAGEDLETIIFFGRIASVTRGWNNQKKVVCEGAMAFFNDTIQRYKKYPSANTTLKSFLTSVLTRHNNQLTDTTRQIQLGNVNLIDPENPEDPTKNIEKKNVYRLTNYQTTIDVISEMCLESEGGYMFVRREKVEGEYINYLDWVNKLDTDINQPAKFGLNLTDLNQEFDADELYTALLPLGADYDVYNTVTPQSGDNPYEKGWYEKDSEQSEPDHYTQTNDTSVESGKTYYEKSQRPKRLKDWSPSTNPDPPYSRHNDYIQNDSAVAKYGFILKTKRWDDVSKKSNLYKKAMEWLKTERFDKLVITCNVADLSVLQPEYDPFLVGKVVRIISPPHGITSDAPIMLPISEVDYNLNTGKKEVTIGTQEQVTLSRITKKGNTKEVRLPDAKYDDVVSGDDD